MKNHQNLLQLILLSVLTLFLGVVLYGCGGNDAPGRTTVLPFRVLDEGPYSDFQQETQQIITNESEWTALWQSLKSDFVLPGSPLPPTPAIDFTRQTVIAVFMGYQVSQSIISVSNIEEKTDEVVVNVLEEPNSGTGGIITHPYQVIAIPRTDKLIRFQVQTK